MKTRIHDSSEGKSMIDFESVFHLLNEELVKIDQSLELVCAGGYVMQLNGYRATVDVDAFYESNKTIEHIIRKVGDEFGINNEEDCELIHQFTNLTVKAVNIIYLVGMKLASAREQDLKDVAGILKDNTNQQPFQLMEKLKDMKFDVDVSVLLDAFGRAYGIEWLEKFYVANESELCKLI